MEKLGKRFAVAALFLMSLTIFHSGWAQAGAPDAKALLASSDRARGGTPQGLKWMIQVESQEGGELSNTTFLIEVKGQNVLARCMSPARRKGELYLFNDRNLWAFRPGMRKPVSLSPRQRLSGQAANGDIATTNYARDYDATWVGEEKIDGIPSYHLRLKAKRKDVTYDGINYWISKDRSLGVQAEFLTLEGKVFKRAKFEYANAIQLASRKEPFVSKMIITDAMFPENITTISYENPQRADLGDALFNVNNLAR